jgi:2-dehydro-3-deoxy-D-arabinonate dehydratase
MQIGRAEGPQGHAIAVGVEDGRLFSLGEITLDELFQLPIGAIKALLERAGLTTPLNGFRLLKPIDRQEVWAAGVTYRRSLEARVEEAMSPDPYERVYRAARPELFFKATPDRVRGAGEFVFIRADSSWDVPEPELAVVCTASLEVIGYTIGNDVSSRSIEGENTLYLPQAKVYDGSCALGPTIAPAWAFDPRDRSITLEVHRGDQSPFIASTTTAAMRRTIPDLLQYLGRANRFPHGVILLTGTGIVPPETFTLQPGDEVVIGIDGLGELRNTVERINT